MNGKWQNLMKAAAVAVAIATAACGGMSTRDRNTLIGAGVGGVAGSALSNGSGVGTVGGAAVGGYIGNQINRR